MIAERVQWAAHPARRPRVIAVFIAVALCLSFYTTFIELAGDVLSYDNRVPIGIDIANVTATAKHFAQTAIQPPYRDQFWLVGQRSQKLAHWLHVADQAGRSRARRRLFTASEQAATALFPFITSSPSRPRSTTPLADLRTRFRGGGRGIVIPVGYGNLRFAGHLVVALREVHDCQLPIEIVYAGDIDLDQEQRDALAALDATANIKFLNVLSVFADDTLSLLAGGWAIKPFGLLASSFEQAILVDADAVFLQSPEALFRQRPFISTGAYLFHDRLLWQNVFTERRDWWHDQIREPSAALNNSLVWTQDYAEECDSGVVVADKARTEVLVGLLHAAWQNTRDVRGEVSYKLMHGDKETWWLGLELAGSGYEFERHYGSMIGWPRPTGNQTEGENDENDDGDARVCSFVIAHADDEDRLLWYNGSLLKNKLAEPETYEVPTAWMLDGKWEKGADKKSMSCMAGAEARALDDAQMAILRRSIDGARKADDLLRQRGAIPKAGETQ
ncbi:glycosyltransferase family 71 [Purpureocillium lavendulum]|uniref:Glycosyltransferase family 71 n=1 Tax=Purpureocillium lavendulum TaxID=1247861 RepID=A0AB34FFA2_9HYPO|nr:glycosyltransferase family 71 [Purpureocillium lavendulum]